MMQLAVTFCSLFFNPNASILGPDTEVPGAIPVNTASGRAQGKDVLAWKGWLASQHGVADTGEPRTAKQAQEARRLTNLTGIGAAVSRDVTQSTTLQSQGSHGSGPTEWGWSDKLSLLMSHGLMVSWRRVKACGSRVCSSMYGASMGGKRMDYKEMG